MEYFQICTAQKRFVLICIEPKCNFVSKGKFTEGWKILPLASNDQITFSAPTSHPPSPYAYPTSCLSLEAKD